VLLQTLRTEPFVGFAGYMYIRISRVDVKRILDWKSRETRLLRVSERNTRASVYVLYRVTVLSYPSRLFLRQPSFCDTHLMSRRI
jgi:hypothetical protein